MRSEYLLPAIAYITVAVMKNIKNFNSCLLLIFITRYIFLIFIFFLSVRLLIAINSNYDAPVVFWTMSKKSMHGATVCVYIFSSTYCPLFFLHVYRMKNLYGRKDMKLCIVRLSLLLPWTNFFPLMARYFDGNVLERIKANGISVFRWSMNTASFVFRD